MMCDALCKNREKAQTGTPTKKKKWLSGDSRFFGCSHT
jgi:hypothetical protein